MGGNPNGGPLTPVYTRVFHNSDSSRGRYDYLMTASKQKCREWFHEGYCFANTRNRLTYAQVLQKSRPVTKSIHCKGEIQKDGRVDSTVGNSHVIYGQKKDKSRVFTANKPRGCWGDIEPRHSRVHLSLDRPRVSCVCTEPGRSRFSDTATSVCHGGVESTSTCQNRFLPLSAMLSGETSRIEEIDIMADSDLTGVHSSRDYAKSKRNGVVIDGASKYQLSDTGDRFDLSLYSHLDSKQTNTPKVNITDSSVETCAIEDKYVAGLVRRKIPFTVVQQAQNCMDYVNSCAQNRGKFGFVPLTPLLLYDSTVVVASPPCMDVLKAHTLVKESNTCNFMKCRIPVKSQLKPNRWRFHLQDYWDRQLPDLIEFGFPLDFNHACHLISTEENHKSALEFRGDVNAYITEELKHNALLGPFVRKPISLHVSPFMTCEKADSSVRRTIVDLSWPKGFSVNHAVSKQTYLGTTFMLNYPSVDNIIETLRKLGPSSLIYKIDISRAFRHIRIDPGDINLLGLKHNDLYYIDECLPFGFRHGSVIFQRVSDGIRYMMDKQFSHNALFNYIDDLIVCGLPSYMWQSFQYLQDLLKDLGLDISVKKLVPPSTAVTCLGILIDTVARTISLPDGKLAQIQNLCRSWSNKTVVTKSEYQSLLGSLLYITKCVRPARPFLNRMLELFRKNYDRKRITLTVEFFRDLHWFNVFLAQYNGVTFYDINPINAMIELDASLTGLGGRFSNAVYALPIPRNYKDYNIVQLEMLNIVVALKIWGSQWTSKKIVIRCDNKAVVDALSSGKARDVRLPTIARNVWLLSSLYNIHLVFQHVYGTANPVADLLSRWCFTPECEQRLRTFIETPMWVMVHLDLTLLNIQI